MTSCTSVSVSLINYSLLSDFQVFIIYYDFGRCACVWVCGLFIF